MAGKRVCIIGAGPSGCSALIQFKLQGDEGGRASPDIVCYEKQKDLGGLWNFTWRTGVDEYGEPVHGSMYRHLWSNGPKECLEYGDYTFDDHFHKPVASFPPRPVLHDYLKGRWRKYGIRSMITFNHSVHLVTYNDTTKRFNVTVQDLLKEKSRNEEFDYVIVATGHFSTPNIPDFPGMEMFTGRVLHGHDFRDANEFRGQKVLIVGSSYSAEDISLQLHKFQAKHVTITYRSKPMNFKWPDGIEERPLLQRIQGRKVTFKDGSEEEYDAIILCTGYRLDNRFMEERLKLRGFNPLYADNLYKNVVWMPAANGQLFYIAQQDQYYTFTMFEVQAFFLTKVILGQIKLPSKEDMEEDYNTWLARYKTLKSCHDDIDFQTDYLNDLKEISGYTYRLDTADMFHQWERDKDESILSYRDRTFVSIFTGTKGREPRTPWLSAMSDTLEDFLHD